MLSGIESMYVESSSCVGVKGRMKEVKMGMGRR